MEQRGMDLRTAPDLASRQREIDTISAQRPPIPVRVLAAGARNMSSSQSQGNL